MARAATKKPATSTAQSTKTGSSKSKRGRPVGSKNRSSVAPLKAASGPTRSTAAQKAVPVAPKLNKAELEVQLAKLERLVVRLREQNKELKAIVKSAQAPKQAIPETKLVRDDAKSAPAAKTRKPRASKTVSAAVAVEDANPSE